MKRLTTAALALVLLAPVALVAQDDSTLHDEIEALRRGQEQIRRELAEIRKLLQTQRRAAPAAAASRVEGKVFEIAGNPVKGDAGAKLTLIEFMDYQCGYCGRHLTQTHPRIVEEFVDSGQLRYAVLDLPLQSIHKLAFKAAEVAHCAADQGKFWEMHERLFANQKNLEPWEAHADALGLDRARFDSCLASGAHNAGVRKDMAEARKAGASGTPSFVLGRTDPDDPNKVSGLAFIRGARPFDDFAAEIRRALEAGE